MLTSAVEEGSTPSSRYHHAASLLTLHESASQGTSQSFMLVVGGVTPNGVASDTWSLNLSSLIWREHPVSCRLNSLIETNCFALLVCIFVNVLFLSCLTELGAAPSGRSYLNCSPRLHSAVNWRLLSRERLQPSSAGIQPSDWELDHCPSHWHTAYRFIFLCDSHSNFVQFSH